MAKILHHTSLRWTATTVVRRGMPLDAWKVVFAHDELVELVPWHEVARDRPEGAVMAIRFRAQGEEQVGAIWAPHHIPVSEAEWTVVTTFHGPMPHCVGLYGEQMALVAGTHKAWVTVVDVEDIGNEMGSLVVFIEVTEQEGGQK